MDSEVPERYRAMPQMGVRHHKLNEDLWDCEGEPFNDWTNDDSKFDMAFFDPRYRSCLANKTGIQGLGPCLQNKFTPTRYILKDEAGKYYYWDEDMRLLLTWTDDWSEEEIIDVVVQDTIQYKKMVDWWAQMGDEKEEDEEGGHNGDTTVMQSTPRTPELSATQSQGDFTPRPRISSPERPESLGRTESPSKRLHEWCNDSNDTLLASDTNTPDLYPFLDSNDTKTTDTILLQT